MSPLPWHLLIPSVAVAAHWYVATAPGKPFNDVVEVFRNATGAPVALGGGACVGVEQAACKEIQYNDLMTEFMDRFQSKRTAYDRWGTFVIASTFLAVPFIVLLTLCSPRWLESHLLLEMAKRHSQPLEVLGYLVSLACGVIGKNLDDLPSAALLWGRCAAMFFVATHLFFGTLRHRNEESKSYWLEWLRACFAALSPGVLSCSLHALVWAATAILHQDALCGLSSLLALFSSLLWLWSELDPLDEEEMEQAAKTGDPQAALESIWKLATRLALVSVLVMLLCQAAFRERQYMTFGAMCCGHIATLHAVLLLSVGQSRGSSLPRQGAVLGTFVCSILLGLYLDAPSLKSGGATCLIFWFLLKCFEAPWANPLFKAFITVALVQLVRQNPEMVEEIMNPKNLYAEGR